MARRRLPTLRLLTPTPRLDGLDEPPPHNMRRRVVELVAYLALHHPQPVSGDRLCTRVLSTGGGDARPKTLFNVAAQARRSLGTGPQGAPLLARAGPDGLYRLTATVPVDTLLAEALVKAGDRRGGDRTAVPFYRAALTLVEGEPLSGVRHGYDWWSIEGHGSRSSAVVVEAACRLARLAIAGDEIGLARWAVERGRRAEPDSEALSRAAMVAAARDGDADALRRAWRDCRGRLGAIDPGPAASPTRATRELYDRLAIGLRSAPSAGPAAAGGDQASLAAMDDALRSTEPSAPAAL